MNGILSSSVDDLLGRVSRRAPLESHKASCPFRNDRITSFIRSRNNLANENEKLGNGVRICLGCISGKYIATVPSDSRYICDMHQLLYSTLLAL